MHNPLYFESVATKCTELAKEFNNKALLDLINEVKDNIEILNSSAEYSSFMNHFFPFLFNIVQSGNVQFTDSPEHKIRNNILEIFSKLPHNDILKPSVQNLLQLAIYLLEVDNEENGLICLRIILDVHKSYRAITENEVQQFLNIVIKMYQDLPTTTEKAFKPPSGAIAATTAGTTGATATSPPQQQNTVEGTSPPTTAPATGSAPTTTSPPLSSPNQQRVPGQPPTSQPPSTPTAGATVAAATPAGPPVRQSFTIPSISSFKVLTECPIMVVLLFQLYPPSMTANVPKFLPLILSTLCLQAPPGSATAAPVTYNDFVGAQAKTLSFLAYILRQCMDSMKEHAAVLAKSVITLLQNCPNYASATRKEILIALRHILNSDFRLKFMEHMDTLLDERVLLGTSRTCFENLRLLAYSTLVDFIHSMKDQLNITQVLKVIQIYSNHLHDSTSPLGIQIMSSKLLISLMDSLHHKFSQDNNITVGRNTAYRIFETILSKFSSLKNQIPKILAENKVLMTTKDPQDPTVEPIKEYKILIKSMTSGLRNVFWSLNNYRNICQQKGIPPYMRTADEAVLQIKLFKSVIKCFPLFGGSNSQPIEEKEILEHFSMSFVILDSRIFSEIMTHCMPFLYAAIQEDQNLILIPQNIINQQTTINSRHFADILCTFLMEKFKAQNPLEKPDPSMLRLLKILLSYVTGQSAETESVLQPVLGSFIIALLKFATESKHSDSVNYFVLLKNTFRACHNKPELFKEFTTLFPAILETMNELILSSCYSYQMILLFSELCLTMPIQTPLLLPSMGLLIRPLIIILDSNSTEHLPISFRLIEMLIDNSTGDFLLNTFKETKQEFLNAIARHLRTAPYFFGPYAVRILGKLAGKSRSLQYYAPTPYIKQLANNTLDHGSSRFSIPCLPQENGGVTDPIHLSVDKAILSCKTILTSKPDAFLQNQSIQFLKSIFPYFLSSSSSSINSQLLQSAIQSNQKSIYYQMTSPLAQNLSPKDQDEFFSDRKLFKSVLFSFLFSSTVESLKTESEYVKQIIYHFSLYLSSLSPNNYLNLVGLKELNPKIFLEALLEVMAMFFTDGVKIQLDDINQLLTDIFKINDEIHASNSFEEQKEDAQAPVPSEPPSDEPYPIFKYLINGFISNCYQRDYRKSYAGVVGINFLLKNLKVSWVIRYEVVILRALLFVTEDLTFQGFQPIIDQAADTAQLLIKICTPVFKLPESMGDQTDTPNPDSNPNQEVVPMNTDQQNTGTASTSTTVNPPSTSTTTSPIPPPTTSTPENLSVTPSTAAPGVAPTTSPKNPSNVVSNSNLPKISIATTIPSVHCSINLLSEYQKQLTSQVLDVLMKNLSSYQVQTRQLVQKLLTSISSDYTKIPIQHLLADLKITIHKLVPKHVRVLSIASQTGVIEAITFCLTHRPPLFPINAESVDTFQKCLNIAGDDTVQYKGHSQKQINQINSLKVAGVAMVASAMLCKEFLDYDCVDFKNKIINVFFKSVITRNKEMSTVAKRGLANAISQQRLQRELLQPCLRPVLANLTEAKSISVPFLQGLSRLLELLSNFFNAALGEKLFEYLKKFEESGKLKWENNKFRDSDEVKICAAIIDIFHLLPPAIKLLDTTVYMTAKLESSLQKEITSPYREPLIRFLAKYPQRCMEIFLHANLLAIPQFCTMFRLILKNSIARPIIEELSNHIHWLEFIKSPNNEIRYQAIYILSRVVKTLPQWLPQRKNILDILLSFWRSHDNQYQLQHNQELSYQRLKETKILVRAFVQYCRSHPEETELLFHILNVLVIKGPVDFHFLRDYYQTELPEKSTSEQKKNILTTFLVYFKDTTIQSENKVKALQYIVIPIINSYFSPSNTENRTIDPNEFVNLVKVVYLENPAPYDDQLLIEILQMGSTLVKNLHQELGPLKNSLIKFTWQCLKHEDLTCKHSAYVLACRFIEVYDTPVKITLQVYVFLLKAYQSESKTLVKQALDILLGCLKYRLPKNSSWVKWTKKTLLEEGHTPHQLNHILQVLVRHAQLFYPYRSIFVSYMVQCVPKVAFSANLTYDQKKLAHDIVEVIMNWERWRTRDSTGENSTTSANPNTPTSMEINVTTPSQSTPMNDPMTPATNVTSEGDDYKLTPLVQEHITLFLARMATTLYDTKATANTTNERSLDLLKQALALWPETNIKFTVFEKPLNSDNPAVVYAILQILTVIMDFQLNTFVTANSQSLQTSLTPSICSDNPKISQIVSQIFKKILAAYPTLTKDGPNAALPNEIQQLYNHVSHTIENQLAVFDKTYNIQILALLKLFKEENPDFISNQILSSLIKVNSKLTSLYLTIENDPNAANANILNSSSASSAALHAKQPQPVVPAKPPSTTPQKKDITIGLIKTYELIKYKALKLQAEQKKYFTQSLLVLLEKSKETELLSEIVNVIGYLITSNSSEGFLTSKEKVNFLYKMAKLDTLGNSELSSAYFNLLHQVYQDPQSSKPELSQLESVFLIGLKTQDPKIRKNLFEVFNTNISNIPSMRIQYIIGIQQWDPLGNTYWLRNALDLLLAILPNPSVSITSKNNQHSKLPNLSSYLSSAETSSMQVDNDRFSVSLQDHEKWLDSMRKINVSDLVSSLREIIFADNQLTNDLWIQLFSQIWAKFLTKEDQYKLSKSLTLLLSKDYSKKVIPNNLTSSFNSLANVQSSAQPQSLLEPNVIRTFLETIQVCQPSVKIPYELVAFLGQNYNAYYTALRILETHLESSSRILNDPTDPVWEYLSGLLHDLGELEVKNGLLKKRYQQTDESRLGIILEEFYCWQSSQEIYLAAMNKYSNVGAKPTSKNENLLWDNEFLECAKRLNQWSFLAEAAWTKNMFDLLIESSWKTSNWLLMKENLKKMLIQGDTSQRKLYQIYAALVDKKPYADIESLNISTNQLIINRWSSLPDPINSTMRIHERSLVEMQQVVEVSEAIYLLKELQVTASAPARANIVMNHIKSIINVWKERLPSKDEDLLVWHDMLTWRQHLLNLIGDSISTLPNYSAELAKHFIQPEIAWNIQKYSHIVRKQSAVEVAMISLSNMFTLQMNIPDIIINLLEQISCYLQLPTHYNTGLTIINCTDLKEFSQVQMSELMRLKGEFLSRLGRFDEANQVFASAINMNDNIGKNWLSWAYFCDNQFTNNQHLDPETKAQWAESAISCYLQSVRCENKYSTKVIPRIFWLLYLNGSGEIPYSNSNKPTQQSPVNNPTTPSMAQTPETPTAGSTPTAPSTSSTPVEEPKKTCAQIVFSAFEKNWSMLPHWVWINVFPQILTGGSSITQFPGYGVVCWQLISKVLYLYPNSIYHYFRKLFSEIKAQIPPNFSGPLPQHIKMTETISIGIQTSHPTLTSEIDTLLNICIYLSSCVPLLHQLNGCLQFILTEAIKLPTESIPKSIEDHFKMIYNQFFEQASKPKSEEFINQCKSEFESEFSEIYQGNSSNHTVSQLIQKIHAWLNRKPSPSLCSIPLKDGSSNFCYDSCQIKMEEFSPNIVDFRPTLLELPSRNLPNRDPFYEYNVKVEKVSLTAKMVLHTNGMMCPRIKIYASNGKVYPFLIEFEPVIARQKTRAQERKTQLVSLLNSILLKHRETRKRSISFANQPLSIAIPSMGGNSNIYLTQYLGGREMLPLSNVSGLHLRDQTQMVIDYRTKLIKSTQAQKQMQTAFKEFFAAKASDQLLNQFLALNLFNVSDQYEFKANFSTNWGLYQLMNYLLYFRQGSTSPGSIYISPNNGTVYYHNWIQGIYNQSMLNPTSNRYELDETSSITPFRLTPNIKSYLSPFYLEGPFQNSIISTAICLSDLKEQFTNALNLYIMDEIVNTHLVEPIQPSPANADKNIHHELVERTIQLSSQMLSNRINPITPVNQPDKTQFISPIIKKVNELVQISINSSSQLDPIAMPWI